MKPRLLDHLVCPKDHSELKMVIWSFRPVYLSQANRKLAHRMQIEPEKLSKEIFEGVLVNHQRKVIYPIVDGIPRLLLFPSTVMMTFAMKHKARLDREFPGYSLPDFQVTKYEKVNSCAFQHQIFANDTEVSAADKAVREAMAVSLELMLNVKTKPVLGQRVLDVGLGFGNVASQFAQNQQCELIGMDISHLVDSVQKSCNPYPFFNLVQASIFAVPFRPSSFDLAYSYGGVNRFHSPKLGVTKMSEMPKPNGRLSIWFDDDKFVAMTKLQRMLLVTERWLRPIVSHFPQRIRSYAIMSCMPIYLIHQRLFLEDEVQLGIRSGVKNALTVAQKRLEVKLNNCLSDKEVQGWVAEQGYKSIRRLREGAHRFPPPLALWNCAGVEGVRV